MIRTLYSVSGRTQALPSAVRFAQLVPRQNDHLFFSCSFGMGVGALAITIPRRRTFVIDVKFLFCCVVRRVVT